MNDIIRTTEEAERYNNLPQYKEEIAAGMLPFIVGDPRPKSNNKEIPYTRDWYKANSVPMNTTKKYYI